MIFTQELPGMDTITSIFLASIAVVLCVGALGLIIALVLIISHWNIYTKAGQPGWAVLVPIYSTLVLLDIIRKPRIWLGYLLSLAIIQFIIARISIAGDGTFTGDWGIRVLILVLSSIQLVLSIRMTHGLSTAFGKTTGFTVGLVLLPIVFYPILGFGSAQYQYQTGVITTPLHS